MANPYGVATPNPLPVGAQAIGSVDIACPAGSETNVIAITVNNPTVGGVYYPNFVGWLAISLGATIPTAIQIGWRLGAGADMASLPVAPAAFVAAATLIQPISVQGAGLIIQNPTGINTFNVSVFPATQGVTVRYQGSFCQCAWVRATDQ